MPTEITPAQQMISSCTGAVITSLTMTPFDVVKVRLQAQQKPIKPGSCFLYSNGLMDCLCVCRKCAENGNNSTKTRSNTHVPHSHSAHAAHLHAGHAAGHEWFQRPSHFRGMTDALIKISRTEGVSALWSGLPPTLLMSIPVTVIYFTLYDRLKYALGYQENNPATKYLPPVAGMMARTFASTLISPVELLRVKMQSQYLTYSQLIMSVRTSIKTNGPLYLWHGLGPSLLRDVPFSEIHSQLIKWFSLKSFEPDFKMNSFNSNYSLERRTHSLTKAQMIRLNEGEELRFVQIFLCGATSGSVAAVLTLPFDVIKTRQQIQLGEAEVTGSSKRFTSISSLILQLYRTQGLTALFAGLVPRIAKVAPACAIMISTYELGKQYFTSKNSSAVL